ncbi:MAG: hypothetical protein WAZ18_06580 [Alphaproteobacteria bacterium]
MPLIPAHARTFLAGHTQRLADAATRLRRTWGDKRLTHETIEHLPADTSPPIIQRKPAEGSPFQTRAKGPIRSSEIA